MAAAHLAARGHIQHLVEVLVEAALEHARLLPRLVLAPGPWAPTTCTPATAGRPRLQQGQLAISAGILVLQAHLVKAFGHTGQECWQSLPGEELMPGMSTR